MRPENSPKPSGLDLDQKQKKLLLICNDSAVIFENHINNPLILIRLYLNYLCVQ